MKKQLKKTSLLLGLVWSISPPYVLTLLAARLSAVAQIVLNVVLPRFLIDELVGARDPARLALFAGIIVLSNALMALVRNATKRYVSVKTEYMAHAMQRRMGEKIMNVSYEHLETPADLDLKERAVFAIRNQSALENMLNHAADLLQNMLTAVSLLAVLMTLSVWLVLAALAIVALTLLLYAIQLKQQYAAMQEVVPINRRYGYYVNSAYQDKLHKDIRLYGMDDLLLSKISQFNREINGHFITLFRSVGRFSGGISVLNDLEAALAYAYVGVRALTDAIGPRIGLGAFTMYVGAVVQFSRAAQAIGQDVVNLAQVLGYLDPFMDFMAIPDEKDLGGDAPFSGRVEGIRFDHVSFRYPGNGPLVLDDVSFEIKKGEKVSIVGLNGAGKTTLVKLLCRLYRPTSGTITVNGRDIFDYDRGQYMREVAAVFQDFKLFAFTVEENITGRDRGQGGDVTGVVEEVGLSEKMASLPDGLGTLLGKAYNEDGTEFSGGEQQKVAIARALYKGASLIVLDEPTSALDPLAEAEIYEHFNALVGDKTAIYISHRMSSSVFCDRILILDGGRVADYDTHAALMKKTDGLYCRLFMSQAENYRIEKELEMA